MVALLLAVDLHRRGRDPQAALCLALGFEKFNLLFLIPLALAAHGRKRLLAWLSLWLAALAGISFALLGPGGFRNYASLLTNPFMDTLLLQAWNLRALLGNLGLSGPVSFTVAMLGALLWFVWLIRQVDFDLAVWLAVWFGLLLSWHSYPYDYALALPLIYLLYRNRCLGAAGFLLVGGMWLHAAPGSRTAVGMTLLALAMTAEMAWRLRAAGAKRGLEQPRL